ncbi:MAG: DUF2062 domain-containing protein [Rhodocyclaceae bacterium]
MKHWLRKHMPDHAAIQQNRWLYPFRNTLLHPRLWHLNRHSAAGAVAVGLFCGLIPGPFQMLGAAICAVIFRINLPLALLTTLYTNPFTIVPLYIAAYALGSGMLALFGHPRQSFIAPPDFGDPGSETLSQWIGALIDWMLRLGAPLAWGLVLEASLLAAIGYAAVRVLWRIWLVRAWRRRIQRRQASIAQ